MAQTFVSYLRVSSARQGASGLGLEAQREVVARHIANIGAILLEEHVEIESGKRSDRPVLAKAMASCRRHRATLLLAKLDRLGRNVAFVSALMETKTDFLALDAPYATPLLVHILAAFAEHEREMISQRTKSALAAAKVRGVKLGVHGAVLAANHKAEATAFAHTIAERVSEVRGSGAVTLQEIADGLNARGVLTREAAAWSPTGVQRVLKRLAA